MSPVCVPALSQAMPSCSKTSCSTAPTTQRDEHPVQRASIAAWNDEEHVIDNRRLYQEKFDRVIPILQQAFDVKLPDASFYIWLKVPDGDDLAFTRNLWQKAAIQVLPGRFLARDTEQGNPGEGYVRIALVADVESCVKAAETMVALYRR